MANKGMVQTPGGAACEVIVAAALDTQWLCTPRLLVIQKLLKIDCMIK